MRASFYEGAGRFRVGPAEVPTAGRDEALLRVRRVGICGTDLHIWLGEYDSVPPVTMGHEVSGIVAELGAGVDAAWLGARAVTETYFSTCAECDWCRAGRPNLCPDRRSIGTHVDGGFAPRLLVPVTNLHRISEGLDAHAAAMAEPLACCCHSLRDPDRVGEGDRVLVVGPGPIGLLAAQVARASGGDVHVRGTPRDATRLTAAKALGFATSTTDDASPGDFDVVVECSGHAAGMAFALESVARGGRYVQIGLAGKPVVLPFDLVCFKELSVTSGFASTPTSWTRALDALESRQVELEPLLSDAIPLDEWERAFAATRAGAGIKYVLVPT